MAGKRKSARSASRNRRRVRLDAGLCTRCGGPTTDRTTTCAPCAALEAERGRPERRHAAARRRYRERRDRQQCTDCGQPAHGASRCEACAKRSYERSDFFRGIPMWDPSFTVIELATGETHGPFDTEAEAVAGLEFDEVEIINDAPITARLTAWPEPLPAGEGVSEIEDSECRASARPGRREGFPRWLDAVTGDPQCPHPIPTTTR